MVTTDSKRNLPVASDLVQRRFKPPEPNRLWCGNITYIHTDAGWLYPVAVIDHLQSGGGLELADPHAGQPSQRRASHGVLAALAITLTDTRHHTSGSPCRCNRRKQAYAAISCPSIPDGSRFSGSFAGTLCACC